MFMEFVQYFLINLALFTITYSVCEKFSNYYSNLLFIFT